MALEALAPANRCEARLSRGLSRRALQLVARVRRQVPHATAPTFCPWLCPASRARHAVSLRALVCLMFSF